MQTEERLAGLRDQIELRLPELLPLVGDTPSRLHEAMRYSALANGKRLRPSLCMASAVAVGGTAECALDAGCAVEFVHCFSLIHDDLPCIDNDELRRGRPTCHIEFGEAMAVLAGDALFALAFEVMAACSDHPDRTATSVRILARATGSYGLVGGEVLDILAEGEPGGLSQLETIHSRKTGALIGASCRIGAALAGADEATAEHCEKVGRSIGLAFQIADDVLNETSSREQLGKAVGSDKARNKLTYPALLGITASQALADQMVEEAVSGLRELPGDTTLLAGLAAYAVERDW